MMINVGLRNVSFTIKSKRASNAKARMFVGLSQSVKTLEWKRRNTRFIFFFDL